VSLTGIDPNPPVKFLSTGQSAKPRFRELECFEAAIGDFTHPATSGHWGSGQKFPRQKNLPQKANSEAYAMNLDRISDIVANEKRPVIWAAWGESILARDYFISAAADLIERLGACNPVWQHFGSMTKSGHPRHPSRLQYAWKFARLDEKDYLAKLRS
jgi:hypothetical protein